MSAPYRLPETEMPTDREACAAVLDLVAAQINTASEQIERAIGSICISFQQIVSRTRQNAQQMAQAIQQLTDPTGKNASDESSQIIRKRLQEVERLRKLATDAAQQIQEVQRITNQVGRVDDTLVEVDALAFSLGIVAINAKLEAVRAGEQGQGFQIVATEVTDVSRKIRSATSSVQGEIRELRRQLNQTMQRIEVSLALNGSDDPLGGLEALEAMNRAQDQLQELVAGSRANCDELANEVSKAIVTMQFQDAVNQQMQHMEEILMELRENLTPEDVELPPEWLERIRSNFTMTSERKLLRPDSAESDASEAGSVELF